MNGSLKPTVCLATACIVAIALIAATKTSWADSAGGLSSVEAIYADLAKLTPQERQKQIEEGARKEGKLIIIQTLRGSEGSGHIALFKKRYPFVDVDATLDIGAQDAAERLLAEETVGRHLTDIIVTSVPDLAELLHRDYLARYPTPADDLILPQYKRFVDSQNRWVSWFWSEQGISYNSNLVPPDKVPKTWLDLCDPFFKGAVSYETLETRFLSGLNAMFGEAGTQALLKCIGTNQPIIQRGHSQRTELMVAGDHMAQANYLYYGLELQKKNPSAPYKIDFATPIFGTADDLAINRNAAHPYASALFADWSLSQESQALIASFGRGPVSIKHPFLPDTIDLVNNVDPPKDIMDRLIGYWKTYMEKKG